MIRKIVLGSVAAAAFAVGGFASTPAQSHEFPVYMCDFVHQGFISAGFGNCTSDNVLPDGEFFGPSLLISRATGQRVFCQGGGVTDTPVRVAGRVCQ